jgi:hypothetical protein
VTGDGRQCGEINPCLGQLRSERVPEVVEDEMEGVPMSLFRHMLNRGPRSCVRCACRIFDPKGKLALMALGTWSPKCIGSQLGGQESGELPSICRSECEAGPVPVLGSSLKVLLFLLARYHVNPNSVRISGSF